MEGRYTACTDVNLCDFWDQGGSKRNTGARPHFCDDGGKLGI
jgi:hypothetical protein